MMLHLQQRQDWIRTRRERRQQAKNARLRRQFLRYFLLVALLVLGASAFKYLTWTLVDINNDVLVDGNHVVRADQVRAALSNCVGQQLYKLDPQVLAQKVKALPAVRYAFVRRYMFPFPHLVVTVLEEFPWATFAAQPDLPPEAVISETGRKIPISQFPSIIQPDLLIYGSTDLNLNSSHVAQWASWMSYIAAQTGEKVSYLDLRSPTDIRIQDGDLYLKIGSADSTLTKRLGRLASIVPAVAQYRGHLQYIDLSLDNNVPFKLAGRDTSSKNRSH